MENSYKKLSEDEKKKIILKAIKISNKEQEKIVDKYSGMNTFKDFYDRKFKKYHIEMIKRGKDSWLLYIDLEKAKIIKEQKIENIANNG